MQETTKEVHKKRRRVSKKNKKSWRKHIDIKDVDKFLEDKRLEERLGNPFDVRSNEELFVVDAAPNDSKAIKFNSKAAYRQALRAAEPRCFASLKPNSAVAPFNKVNTKSSKKETKLGKGEKVSKSKS
ncbi:hypothetical protein PV325_003985 [Microctonus aethiopoides]|uniref:Ribosome biogenesis protein NOP53 n=1 Tax=Microctonus aethiopoides TaxID=144406 RepID=A0AA39F8D8_9HYME|nr:hypothetical protein PV325_003985 [Microctonus aethiopoides]KAK0091435.1 hypothetical protein PV326_003239 [Microctonus aethiopoides]KAK0164857.1 hypothetical protein PV328_003426 [Microctonus aethiopoides]